MAVRELSTRAERVWAWAVLAAGLLTIALAVVLQGIFPAEAELERGFRSPVLAFEFARSADDLAFLAGPGEGPREMRRAMDEGHRWDTIFPFAYGGMLLLLLLRHGLRGRVEGWVGTATACVTVIGDLTENQVLTSITAVLERGEPADALLPGLWTATWIKWGALGLTFAALALCRLRERRPVTAVATALPAVAVGLTYLTGAPATVAEIMAKAVAGTYVVLIGATVVELYRLHKDP